MSRWVVNCLLNAPELIVCAAGLVLALCRWRRHPQVSLLIVTSTAITLVTYPLSAYYAYEYLPRVHAAGHYSTGMAVLTLFLRFLAFYLAAAAAILLFVAAFGWRAPQASSDRQ